MQKKHVRHLVKQPIVWISPGSMMETLIMVSIWTYFPIAPTIKKG